jgi:hypothetical protein
MRRYFSRNTSSFCHDLLSGFQAVERDVEALVPENRVP